MKSFSSQQRLVIVISIMASFVSFLDGFAVNVALPAIAQELGGGLATQQWVVNAYLLALGSLMLVAGSFSDIFGRVRILCWGLVSFGVASVLCAVAPNELSLIIARAFQGAAGALLVPSSLALIMSTFDGASKGRAVGIWTSWTVVASVTGPLLGGFLVDVASWRFIFAINIAPILITLWLLRYLKPVEGIRASRAKIDGIGAFLCALALGSATWALIEQPRYGWHNPLVYGLLALGIVTFCLFIRHERQTTHPMMPLSLFTNRNFTVGNVSTLFIYAGLGLSNFIVAIFLQQIAGFSAFTAGLAFLPVTGLMFMLSSYFGKLAGLYGPRWFMAFGPIIAGIGFLLMLRVDASVQYLSDLLPGILCFGIGLSVTVAPLTSAILGAIESRQSGIGSAVNNAIARIAGLVAVSVVGVAIGTSVSLTGFHSVLMLIAGLLFAGGLVAAVGIQNSAKATQKVGSK